MNATELIDAVAGRVARFRRINFLIVQLLPLALLGLLLLMLWRGYLPRPFELPALGFAGLVLLLCLERTARLLRPVPREEAATHIDRAVSGKERFLAVASAPPDVPAAALIAAQSQQLVPVYDPAKYLPFRLERFTKLSACVTAVVAAVLVVLLLHEPSGAVIPVGELKRSEEEAAELRRLAEQLPDLPPELKQGLNQLADTLEEEGLSSGAALQDLEEALREAAELEKSVTREDQLLRDGTESTQTSEEPQAAPEDTPPQADDSTSAAASKVNQRPQQQQENQPQKDDNQQKSTAGDNQQNDQARDNSASREDSTREKDKPKGEQRPETQSKAPEQSPKEQEAKKSADAAQDRQDQQQSSTEQQKQGQQEQEPQSGAPDPKGKDGKKSPAPKPDGEQERAGSSSGSQQGTQPQQQQAEEGEKGGKQPEEDPKRDVTGVGDGKGKGEGGSKKPQEGEGAASGGEGAQPGQTSPNAGSQQSGEKGAQEKGSQEGAKGDQPSGGKQQGKDQGPGQKPQQNSSGKGSGQGAQGKQQGSGAGKQQGAQGQGGDSVSQVKEKLEELREEMAEKGKGAQQADAPGTDKQQAGSKQGEKSQAGSKQGAGDKKEGLPKSGEKAGSKQGGQERSGGQQQSQPQGKEAGSPQDGSQPSDKYPAGSSDSKEGLSEGSGRPGGGDEKRGAQPGPRDRQGRQDSLELPDPNRVDRSKNPKGVPNPSSNAPRYIEEGGKGGGMAPPPKQLDTVNVPQEEEKVLVRSVGASDQLRYKNAPGASAKTALEASDFVKPQAEVSERTQPIPVEYGDILR